MGLGQPVDEHGAVGQTGQRVVERLVGELLLERLALGDVPEGDDRPDDLAFTLHRGDGVRHRDEPAAAMGEDVVVVAGSRPGHRGDAEQAAVRRTVDVGVDDVVEVAAEQLAGIPAEQRLGGRVDEVDSAMAVERDHALAEAGRDRAHLLEQRGVGQGG